MNEYSHLKEGVKWLWSLGDYSEVATRLEPYARNLAQACGIEPGIEVLDVAAGNGNFAVAAARLGAHITASDLAPAMVELGRAVGRRNRGAAALRRLGFCDRVSASPTDVCLRFS